MADLTKAEVRAPGQHAHLGWALVLISVAQLMVVLDATIANIALPYIGAGPRHRPGEPVLDRHRLRPRLRRPAAARRTPRRPLRPPPGLHGGLTIFAIASLLGGLAQNEALLLGARGLQGLGAALASPAALALITTTFPAGPQRNRAFAIYAAMSGAGAAVGLILGGWLTGLDSVAGIEMSGWRLTFLINVPIGLAAAAIAPRLLAESESHHGRARLPGRPHRHPRPARHRVRPDPGRQRRLRLGRPLDDRLAGRRRRCSWACSPSSSPGWSTRCCRCGSCGTAPARPASSP